MKCVKPEHENALDKAAVSTGALLTSPMVDPATRLRLTHAKIQKHVSTGAGIIAWDIHLLPILV